MTNRLHRAASLALASSLAAAAPGRAAPALRPGLPGAAAPDSVRWGDPCGTVSGRYVTATRDPDGVPTFRVVDGRDCLELRATGPVELDADGDVRRVPAGGALLVQETRDGRTRRMAVREADGRLARAYAVDGAPRPAAEGAGWLRAALRRVADAGLAAELLRRPGTR